MSVWNDILSTLEDWKADRQPKDLSFGKRGEQVAEKFLKKQRYRIVARGYRNHIGEIDLIAIDTKAKPRTVVFVEVKTRQSDFRGLPVEAVDEKKQRQITHTAMVYLKKNDLLECRYRFDVIGILWPELDQMPTIEHFQSAFESTADGQLFN